MKVFISFNAQHCDCYVTAQHLPNPEVICVSTPAHMQLLANQLPYLYKPKLDTRIEEGMRRGWGGGGGRGGGGGIEGRTHRMNDWRSGGRRRKGLEWKLGWSRVWQEGVDWRGE